MFFKKGPYLQKPEQDSILIFWETHEPSVGEVHVYDASFPHFPAHANRAVGTPRVFPSNTQGTFHKVQITGLSAGTEYYYEVICDGDSHLKSSGKLAFWTAPQKEDPVSFALTAEFGGVGNPNSPYLPPIRELIRREHPHFIQSVGDLLSYGPRACDWDTYLFTPFKQLMRNVPLYPCTSNHEIASDATAIPQEQRAVLYKNYEHYFAFPPSYSYDYGCAHFFVLDCLDFFTHIAQDEQDNYIPCLRPDWKECETYRLMENDLRSSDASWKFVVFHFPLYTTSQFDVRELRVLAPLFEECGVDIVFNSHAIIYERTHPIKANQVHPDGVRYLVVGGYGDFDSWFREKSSSFTAKLAARPNYVHVALTPWRLELQAVDYEGKLFDSLVLEKKK